ncbi:MAG: DJ-1/PfpI family protein [Duncaniella sp.]|nr:DJ-1/PfpI family protein [Bacteroides sp.]MDE5827084.1 DJ-1/PfpI family protein [Duncaniella sp.]MBD5300350.1 DJ-1/PfpI family protein [Bacteroides sp.]MDE6431592.1 DJ-1/PfpI family protein [Duncaniella sp.]MDE6812860.1 DJ-1/PfpI family protein [Duncaniella sp.]
MEKTYVFLADGFEEIEALATVDLLRRAGIHVETVSINPTLAVRGAHDIEVAADIMLADCPEGARMYIVPGGMPGAKNLADNPKVCQILTAQHEAGGKIAAICAAPAVVLAPLGIINEYEATCYPGFEEGVTAGGAHHKNQRVVVDRNIITANGPSSAVPFALTIIEALKGQDAADKVAAGILL